MKNKTVEYVMKEIDELNEFRTDVRDVFKTAQEATPEKELGFLCGRVLKMIDKEIKRLRELETTESYDEYV